jgi:hypothetical protein
MTLRFRTMTLVCLAAGAAAAADNFSRYEVILDRKPFGQELAPAPALVIPPGESVVNKVKMTAVVRDEAGVVRVGIVDLKDKRNYLLGIGESLGELEVVEADYELERARLRRGPEDYWVSMLGGSNRFEAVTGAPAGESRGTTKEPATTAAAPAPRPFALSPRASHPARKGELDQRLSYALRRLQRDAARRRAEETAGSETGLVEGRVASGTSGVLRAGQAGAKTAAGDDAEVARVMQALNSQQDELTPEEVAQLLQEYQKTLIRSGQTPLPIPLTPDTDAQLVGEGYLPAP